MQDDTIFALATPPGQSALAVIRLSGGKALLAPGLFGCERGGDRQAIHAFLKSADQLIIDEVILISFIGPASPTGEDVVEIHCHGSMAVIDDILSVLAKAPGFRPALAGEFTRRALDRGKIDITGAEGLADLIEAETSLQRRQATAQMTGQLKKPSDYWRGEILKNLAHLEAVIDFADEDLPDQLCDDIIDHTQKLIKELSSVLDDSHYGEIIRSGLSIILLGPVNAGKSTALNALARRKAAIVSEQAGTTRDVIEIRLDLLGVPVVLIDTAGWRETADEIEIEGIKRARQQASEADLALIIVDGSEPGWSKMATDLKNWTNCPALFIINKADKGRVEESVQAFSSSVVISTSLIGDETVAPLERALSHHISSLNRPSQSPIITRTRHRDALHTACDALQHSLNLSIKDEIELVAEDYRAAAAALARISGHIDVDDLLDHIFSRFCIGK